jgi:hypothetical protein
MAQLACGSPYEVENEGRMKLATLVGVVVTAAVVVLMLIAAPG